MLTSEERTWIVTEKYYDLILPLITEKGELGVNEIARYIDVPPSTVQKYLTDQKYFKKTEKRKWDLPDRVNTDIKSDTLSLMVNSVENALLILKAQLTDLVESVDNSLGPVKTLKRGVTSINTPVATKSGESVDIDPRLLDLDKKIKDSYAVFKKYVKVVPDEYRELILNFDYMGFTLAYGTEVANGDINEDISALLLEKTSTLSEDTIEMLKEFQKDDNS